MHAVGHATTELKRPSQPTTKRTEPKEKPQLSPLNDPLMEVVNGNVTPLRSFQNGSEGTRAVCNSYQSGVTQVSAFDRMYVVTTETTKNDMILNIVPKDPHLSGLAETL